MIEAKENTFGRFLLQVILGSLAVSLITYFCFGTPRIVVPAFLYLLVVVLQSLWGEFAPAAIVSLIATACLEYYFIPPVLEWQIDDPADAVVLAVCLATSLVITKLASQAHAQARLAERKRGEASSLYDAASRLLALDPGNEASAEPLSVLREVFALTAISFFDLSDSTLRVDGVSRHGLAEKTREAGIRGEDLEDKVAGLHIRCVRVGTKVSGAVGFEARIADDSMTLALSALAATAMERIRSFHNASKAAADAKAEMLRSAILDAFAHEFKTPLAIILAAAGGLREAEGTSVENRRLEMADIIENQTVRLSRLTTRLLRIARLDTDQVSLQMEAVNLSDLTQSLIDQCSQTFGRPVLVSGLNDPAEAMADAELLGLAIMQLLDNACKYSFPGTPVRVELENECSHAHIRVANEGIGIPAEEQAKVFERFFRGAETERITAGAGLGLFVARRIIHAHGGTLELDSLRSSANLTTFHITIPVIQYERQHELRCHQSISR
jgi:two-component system sensor histidine kinase KdpD